MKVQVESLSPIERKLSIEVPPDQVKAEMEKAYTHLGRHVKIAGFRPGKVPRRILEQRYKQQVEEDVVQRVVERSYLAAVRENKVDAVAPPQVTPGVLSADAPFTFEARVEVKPEVTARDYTDLPLKKVDRAVDDAKVDEQLQSMRESNARLEPVEDRKVAQAGDFAQIDYQATIEGKTFPGSDSKDITVEVAPGELTESKLAALEGVEVGGTKDVDYAFATDYRVEEVRGKTAKFHITLNALKRRVVPELNDDFAKETGEGAQTLAELKTQLKTQLEKASASKAESDEREALLQVLVDKNPFEIPNAMVERALDVMLDGALRNLARSGLDPRMLNLDFNHLRGELRERAVREVKGALILEAIAKQEKIEAADADIDARIEELARDSGQPVAQVKKQFRTPDQRESLGLRLREEKSVEFVKARAKYS